ncbi:MAG: hypothetical protein Q7T41_02540 [Candidatus Saccharibacteria bacterium]|nr:hypothetical protein [Candidatus Saccharibacteria bacterium]
MKKKTVLCAALIILLTIATSTIYVMFASRKSEKSDEEIKEMFVCNRATLDFRATDIYCNDPELYRAHRKVNKVVSP